MINFDFTDIEVKNSLIPDWNLNFSSMILQNNASLQKSKNYINFKEYVMNEFKNTNRDNELTEKLDESLMNIIIMLNENGIEFDFGYIKIKTGDIIFPICDVGKNRSQFMFYYLKNIQNTTNNMFYTGYPSSGDELISIIENTNNILTNFRPTYKNDNLSKILEIITGHEITRSIHIFHNILKEKEVYSLCDLKNYEKYKYSKHKCDIYTKSNNDKIKELFKKYFLNPNNIRKLLNNDSSNVIYLCLSPQSFYNMCKLLKYVKDENPLVNLKKTKIIYYGTKDIFQGSCIKKEVFDKYLEQINKNIFVSKNL